MSKLRISLQLIFGLILGLNLSLASQATLPGMISIPSGEFYMGREQSDRPDETPRHKVHINEFFIDETLVTYKAFQKFAEAQNYKSTAEMRGYGMVAHEGMRNWKWEKVEGATWRKPFGPKAKIELQDDFPVVLVSWSDANAYCKSLGKRLPSEAEWEYAARSGSNDTRFPWGDSVYHHGKVGLNFWQGHSHTKNKKLDSYLYMSPVKAFPPNKWGLYDPVGNVWQWVQDWYSSTTFSEDAKLEVISNPQGPKEGKRRVSRGGSWWCSPTTCDGFGLFFRGKAHPEAVFNNNGFRCAL